MQCASATLIGYCITMLEYASMNPNCRGTTLWIIFNTNISFLFKFSESISKSYPIC